MQLNDQKFAVPEDEISFYDLLNFLVDNWKIILGVSVIGAAFSGGYLVLTPRQYEANALVETAQIYYSNSNNNGTMPTAVTVESPSMLLERLKIPTTYTPAVVRDCELEGQMNSDVAITKMVTAALPRGLTSAVSITVRHRSPELAKQCAMGVFEMVLDQQAELAKPYYNDLNSTLSAMQSSLHEKQLLLLKMEKVGAEPSVYLAKHEETLFLKQKISELQRLIQHETRTRLVSPVYVSNGPVHPKRLQTLIQGTLAGLMLGLAVVLGRKLLTNWRASRR